MPKVRTTWEYRPKQPRDKAVLGWTVKKRSNGTWTLHLDGSNDGIRAVRDQDGTWQRTNAMWIPVYHADRLEEAFQAHLRQLIES